MSAAASTDVAVAPLPAVLEAAARGELPAWARVSTERYEHISRVARLLGEWAEELGLPREERDRWVAAGYLHDALRDADPEELRREVPPEMGDLHPLLLHGPAAAERLRGQLDQAFLDAVRYHTIGHPDLGSLGRALYLADFLEPGREFDLERRAQQTARMPHEMDEVLVEVVRARIEHLLEIRKPLRPETAAFWSALVSGR